jgi:hypothetical protein
MQPCPICPVGRTAWGGRNKDRCCYGRQELRRAARSLAVPAGQGVEDLLIIAPVPDRRDERGPAAVLQPRIMCSSLSKRVRARSNGGARAATRWIRRLAVSQAPRTAPRLPSPRLPAATAHHADSGSARLEASISTDSKRPGRGLGGHEVFGHRRGALLGDRLCVWRHQHVVFRLPRDRDGTWWRRRESVLTAAG